MASFSTVARMAALWGLNRAFFSTFDRQVALRGLEAVLWGLGSVLLGLGQILEARGSSLVSSIIQVNGVKKYF